MNKTIEEIATEYVRNYSPEVFHHIDIDWFVTQLVKFVELYEKIHLEERDFIYVDTSSTAVMNTPKKFV